jgi:hypothetical protein
MHVLHAVAAADELDAAAVISTWPSKLNGDNVLSSTFVVEPCDMHWLLGRYKAAAAGLGGAEMAAYFPVHRECFVFLVACVLSGPHHPLNRRCSECSSPGCHLVRRCRGGRRV